MTSSKTDLSHLVKHRTRFDQRGRRGDTKRLLLLVVIFLIGALISSAVFFAAGRRERGQKRLDFELEAQELFNSMRVRFSTPRDLLQLVASFFAASEEVTRSEFRTMVQPVLERHRSLAMIEWMPLVQEADRDAFVAAVRAEGFQSFRIQQKDPTGGVMPAARRSDYLPILFLEPLNPLVLGLDAGAEASEDDVVTRARMTGRATASPPMNLIADPADMFSVIYYKPVLRPVGDVDLLNADASTDADAGDVLSSASAVSDTGVFIGLVTAILRIEHVVSDAIEAVGLEGIQVRLTDETDTLDPIALYDRGYDANRAPNGFEWTRTVEFADRIFTLRMTPVAGSHWLPSGGPIELLFIGFIISALVAAGSSAFLKIGHLKREVDEALELGQYKMVRQLGEGGMGVVYEAKHQMLARSAAIKLIRPSALEESASSNIDIRVLLGRFEREARATAALSSPNTIEIYDYGRTDDGDFYYVMELLEGLDLWNLVQDKGMVDPSRAIYILRQICHSLAEAHDVGLIHRDIKPQNIYLSRRGRDYDVVKVLDFGLVKEMPEAGDGDPGLTMAGVAIGTPAFMAPEIAVGWTEIDGRSDLYAVGCVAYWLLTGRPVFDKKDSRSFLLAHAKDVPVPPSVAGNRAIPADLEAVVLACLAKDPDDRPANADDLSARLSKCACADHWNNERARRWWIMNAETEITGRVVEPGPKGEQTAETVPD